MGNHPIREPRSPKRNIFVEGDSDAAFKFAVWGETTGHHKERSLPNKSQKKEQIYRGNLVARTSAIHADLLNLEQY